MTIDPKNNNDNNADAQTDMAFVQRVRKAAEAIRAGGMVIMMDDPGRENEGDIVMAAQHCTPEHVNFMKKHARGLVCTPMEAARLAELNLGPMVRDNTGLHETAFTISVDALEGTTTGISAADMAVTIQRLADPKTRADELGRPGHIFPLAAHPSGVLGRNGQTEGSVDLCRIAGLEAAAVICEVCNDDGTMARLPELREFSEEHGLPIVHVSDIAAYRRLSEELVQLVGDAKLPTEWGEFRIFGFEVPLTGEHHVAIVKGDLAAEPAPLVRIHSECLTGDVFHSRRCDCGDQLAWAMQVIAGEGTGAVIYLRQEGRGIGLLNKIRAYALQDKGMDTVEANLALGLPVDGRDYSEGAQMLRRLGADSVRLITNNPEKVVGLEQCGIEVAQRVPVPLEVMYDSHNASYLATKVREMGHMIDLGEMGNTGGAAEAGIEAPAESAAEAGIPAPEERRKQTRADQVWKWG